MSIEYDRGASHAGNAIAKTLTANELASLERIAHLRGLVGQLRAAIRNACDEATPGTTCYAILHDALKISPPTEEKPS